MLAIRTLTGNVPYNVGIIRNILICIAVFLPGVCVYAVLLRLTRVKFGSRGMEKVTQSEQVK